MSETVLEEHTENNFQGFIAAIQEALGSTALSLDGTQIQSNTFNITGYNRQVLAILHPSSIEDVACILKIANCYKIPLYPVSQGKNWGLGSKTPVSHNNAILDLSQMNKILEVNTTFGYAIVEPGVTQKQLADYLEKNNINYFLDVTGSGCDTSVMGNTLERGTAYNSLRVETCLGLEIITGNGEILNTGYNSFLNAKTKNLYKYGIGPDLTGLFFQSNFGITTKLVIKLTPIMPCRKMFIFSLKKEKNLTHFLENLRILKSYSLFTSIIHLGNKKRSEITIHPLIQNFCTQNNIKITPEKIASLVNNQLKGTWSGIGSLMGTKRQMQAIEYELRKRLSKYGKVKFINLKHINIILKILNFFRLKKQYAFLSALKPLLGLTIGKPTDAALHSVAWSNNETLPSTNNPDHTNAGFIFCLPLIPLQTSDINQALNIIKKTLYLFQKEPSITLNILNEHVIEAVINITFNKSNKTETEKAHECIKQLNANLIQAGYYPYRMDVNNIEQIFQENSHWRTISKLKKLFDPHNIIAPGRYAPS